MRAVLAGGAAMPAATVEALSAWRDQGDTAGTEGCARVLGGIRGSCLTCAPQTRRK